MDSIYCYYFSKRQTNFSIKIIYSDNNNKNKTIAILINKLQIECFIHSLI